MNKRSYGSYCGIAKALELVGERWALLIVRDLILGPKRFTDLARGLPKIPSNILSARLKELEDAGVVRRTVLPRPQTGVAYELTEYGADLEGVLLQLGCWGARSLGEPAPDDIVTTDSIQLALRATFHPAAAQGVRATYQLNMGPVTIHAIVDDGALEVGAGPLENADLVLDVDLSFRELLMGEVTPKEAIAKGNLRATGKQRLLPRFFEMFRLAPAPVAA